MKINISKDVEITATLLEKILTKCNPDIARLHKLDNYYCGKHDILKRQNVDASKPNNKVVNPYPAYITDTLSGYFVGEPITYSSIDDNCLDVLNMILTYNDAAALDMSLARDASIFGVAYEMLYIDEEGALRLAKVNPQDVIIIYDDSIEENILYAIRKVPLYDIMSDKRSWRIEVYSASDIAIYNADESFNSITITETIPHYFNDVPFIEYKNNEHELGDFETIIPLIDAYDNLTSDSLNDYDYFVDAYLMLTGVTADAEDIAAMKENRVLLLDEGSSAEWLIKAENDSTAENVKNRIQKDIHKFAKVPDLSDENFASNASGIAIKFKLYGTETLIANKERYFQKGIQRRIELIFNVENVKGSAFDWRAIAITFTRDIPTNETEIADVVQKLAGVVSKETLLTQIPFITDTSAELERIEREKEQNPFYDLEFETAEIQKEEQ